MVLQYETIRADECCSCDECGRELITGDTAAVDLEAVAIFCKALRSAPEQKSFPAPRITTARSESSASASLFTWCKASLSAAINSSFKALRLSGRLSVMIRTLPSFVTTTTFIKNLLATNYTNFTNKRYS